MADLTIDVVEAPTKTSDCGGARSKVEWKMSGKNGWIIQHLVVENDALDHLLKSESVCCEGRKENVVTGTPMPEPPAKPETPKPVKNVLKSVHATPPWSRIGRRQRRPREDVEKTTRRCGRGRCATAASG